MGRESPQTLDELLEQGTRRAAGLEDQPLVQARVLEEIGRVYFQRGEFHPAETTFQRVLEIRRRVLGADDPAVANTISLLGDVARRLSQFDRAETLYRQALTTLRRPGVPPPDLAHAIVGLGSVETYRGRLDQALQLYDESLAIRRAGLAPGHPEIAESLRFVAATLRRQGRHAEATARYREVLDIERAARGEESVATARAMIHLADQHFHHNGQPDLAEPLLRQALTTLRGLLGDRDPELVHGLHVLAAIREAQGDTAAAEALYDESLAIAGRAFGERSWRYASQLSSRAVRLARRGDFDDAEAIHLQALSIVDSLYHPSHRLSLSTRVALADIQMGRGQFERAEATYRAILELRRRAEGVDTRMVAGDLERLASAVDAQGRTAEAVRLLEEALAIYSSQMTDGHRAVQRTLTALGRLHERQGRPDEARRYRARLQEQPRLTAEVR